MTAQLVEVVTTVATEADAARMASEVVEARLAACVHVEPIRSFYQWGGLSRDEPEMRLTMKTMDARADALERWLREEHPYDTPMILRRTALGINADYLEWVRSGTRPVRREPGGEGGA
jgi:periplasmic divalent cation tolerance protein